MKAGALDPILRRSRERLLELPSELELERAAARAPVPRSLMAELADLGFGVIAEMKRRSPSAGSLRPDLDVAATAEMFEAAGAVAISVLTEPDSFGGSIEDLRLARQRSRLPILRKDFVIHPLQVVEARAAGADLVLLIVRALPAATLAECLATADELGMDALVEVHDRSDLQLAVAAGARLIGINNRDLDRLTTDLAVTEQLAPLVPEDRLVISESGISTPADASRVRAAGANAILVGEALMRGPDPAMAIRQLVGIGARECG